MRRIIAAGWILAVACPVQAQFTFITNNGAITIAQFTGAGGNVIIPGSTNGYPVTTIGDDAFRDCSGLASVVIPGSVTAVGDGTFEGCIGLTNVTIGDSVATIGDAAFDYCPRLRTVTIPDSVTSIGGDVFDGSGLTNVTIGNSVTSISAGAFRYCPLMSVTIPNSVTNIGIYAFYMCQSMTSVTIGSGVNSIDDSAFEYCGSLTNIDLEAANPNYASAGGVLFDKTMTALVQYPKGLTGGYVVPNSVTRIGGYAFQICPGLMSVTIPNSVTNIGSGAFLECSQLTNAYFKGNAPSVNGGPGSLDDSLFHGDSGTAYYVPGTTGWGANYGGWPTAPWYQPEPQILGSAFGLGAQGQQFNFTVSWATNASIIIEACTNLADPAWTPLATNVLVNGAVNFSDPQWVEYPSRYYRITTP
ncbi:MAG: leucine-rich repeat domain-containing protein [Verrucomicrobiota bacterium]|jgi:hypothetical protein